MKNLQSSLETLAAVAKDLKTSYIIKGSFTSYGRSEEKCSVTLNSKSFTAYGKDCVEDAVRKCVINAVNIYSIFEGIRDEINEAAREKELICKPSNGIEVIKVSKFI